MVSLLTQAQLEELQLEGQDAQNIALPNKSWDVFIASAALLVLWVNLLCWEGVQNCTNTLCGHVLRCWEVRRAVHSSQELGYLDHSAA